MKKTIAALVLSGIIWVMPIDNYLVIGEDTNKDGVEDVRKGYIFKGIDPSGSMVYEHTQTYQDLNNNLKFEENELVWSLDNPKI